MTAWTTRSLQMDVTEDGLIQAIRLLPDGRSILAHPSPILKARTGETLFPASRFEPHGDGTGWVAFDGCGCRVRLEIQADPARITFTVREVAGGEPDELVLADWPVRFPGMVGGIAGIVRNEQVALAIQGLNWFTDAGVECVRGRDVSPAEACLPQGSGVSNGREPVRLWATAVRPAGLVGARWCLLACPAAEYLAVIERIEREEPGLPHLTDDQGRWWRHSPECRKAYLVIYETVVFNPSRLIEYAVQGGFPYLYLGDSTWAGTWGHFDIQRRNFPGGDADLIAFGRAAERRGLKLGFHCLSGAITANDRYVTPVPDERLAARGWARLETGLGPYDVEIRVTDVSGDFCHRDRFCPGIQLGENRQAVLPGGAFRLNREVLRCDSMIRNETDGTVLLKGATRGAYGTAPAAARAGDRIARLVEDWAPGTFFPDVDSPMLEAIAVRLADLANRVPFRMTSFDGWEGLSYRGLYGSNRFLHEVVRRWQHPVIADASMHTHYGWHVFPKYNSGEFTYNVRGDMEERSRYHNFTFFERNLYRPGVGWQWIRSHRDEGETSTVDEIEYLFSRAAGFRASCAVNGEQRDLDEHGETPEILAATRAWQTAIEADAFSEGQRERMRQKGTDFHLEQRGDGRWILTQQKWTRRRCARVGGTDTLTLENPFERQVPELQIRGLFRFERENPANIAVPLPDLAWQPRLDDRGRFPAPDIRFRAAGGGLELSARRPGAEPHPGAYVCAAFPRVLDLRAHRGVGLDVEGDGSGALLVVELLNPSAQVRQYYWRLDFTGRRWLELPNGETQFEDYYDHMPWLPSWSAAMRFYDYAQISGLAVGFHAMRPDGSSACAIHALRLLAEINDPIGELEMHTAAGAARFPVALRPHEFIRLHPDGQGVRQDRNRRALEAFQMSGPLPMAVKGPNAWRVQARGNRGHWVSVRACFSRPPEEVPA